MTATTDFLPSREADLVAWSANFDLKITATPLVFGLTAAQATTYNGLHTAFVSAWEIANRRSSRTPTSIVEKNAAKDALIENARLLAGIVQRHPGTTNAERSDLQINLREEEPTPIPAPSSAPVMEVVERSNRTIKIRLHDVLPGARGKPAGVDGALVFSYVGTTPPADVSTWKLEANATRTVVDINFPLTVAPSSQVWLTAYWYNPRGQSGPACAPVSTKLDSTALAMAA